MERKIEAKLAEWKSRPDRKPLLVRGPRGAGKTWAVRKFGEAGYRKVLEVDLEHRPGLRDLLDGDPSADGIFLALSRIFPDFGSFNGCLLFLDGIHACSNAVPALEALSADGRCDIVCAGTYLGSPWTCAGCIETAEMGPMDFEEFLWAIGYSHDRTSEIAGHVRAMDPFDGPVLKKLNDLFMMYVTIGGMPEAVEAFARTRTYNGIIPGSARARLLDDIQRYCGSPTDRDRIAQCLDSIPKQLCRTSGSSFRYSDASGQAGYGRREFGRALRWLEDAGAIAICHNLMGISEPFMTRPDGNTFKAYLRDTGMTTLALGPDTGLMLTSGRIGKAEGALLENAVASALAGKGHKPHYYSDPANRVEIDFVAELNGKVAAIGVDSGRKRPDRQLLKLDRLGQHADVLISVSGSNLLTDENGIRHIPYFGPSFFEENRSTDSSIAERPVLHGVPKPSSG